MANPDCGTADNLHPTTCCNKLIRFSDSPVGNASEKAYGGCACGGVRAGDGIS